jgi:ankyrin repeat protein
MTASTPNSLLADAIRRHDTEACKRLLADGADPNASEPVGFDQMLSIAAGAKAPLPLCVALIDAGAAVSPPSIELPGPLFRAAKEGYLALCKELVARGANPDGLLLRTPRAPLAGAASEGHLEVCRYLIESGADLLGTSGGGWTALHHAALGAGGARSLEVCKLLVSAGAKPSHRSTPDQDWIPHVTPFHIAITSANESIVSYFLHECGESPSQTTDKGERMLDLTNDEAVLELLRTALIEEAVSVNIKDATADLPQGSRSSQPGML